MPLRAGVLVSLAIGLLLSASAGAARETSNFVFAVTAKGTPQPAEVFCQSSQWSGESQLCLAPGSTYRWSGLVRDGAAGLAGRLTGRCAASGGADGDLGGGVTTVSGKAFTLSEQGQAVANCSFTLSFRHGSLTGTAVVTSLLDEGDTPGTSSETVALSVTGGTGVYAGRTGRGAGKFVTTVSPTTVDCLAVYAGCRLPIPLVIPAVDTQSEDWHLTLRI